MPPVLPVPGQSLQQIKPELLSNIMLVVICDGRFPDHLPSHLAN